MRLLRKTFSLSVDTDILIKYKIRKTTDSNGVEHIETYDLKQSQTYGKVWFHLTNLLGGDSLGKFPPLSRNVGLLLKRIL